MVHGCCAQRDCDDVPIREIRGRDRVAARGSGLRIEARYAIIEADRVACGLGGCPENARARFLLR
jgi:hypothetical protein